MKMKDYRLEYGSYGGVEQVRGIEGAVGEAGEGEVLVELVSSPVNPSDLGMIGGSYGELDELPAVPGREGVGRIVKGEGEGKLVYLTGGCWRRYSWRRAVDLIEVGAGIDEVAAGMLQINPVTAYCLLKKVAMLNRGDWVIQNAGNSAVGCCVVGLCRDMGVKTVSYVRDSGYIDKLKELGGDEVFLEGQENDFKEKGVLGLNSIGGSSVINVIKMMKEGAQVVTFGGMVGEKVRYPTRELIFGDVVLRGFWLQRYMRTLTREAAIGVIREVEELVRRGVMKVPVSAEYELEQYEEALSKASGYGRWGKVVFKG